MPGGVLFAMSGVIDQDLIVRPRLAEDAVDRPQDRMARLVDKTQGIGKEAEIGRSQSVGQPRHVVFGTAQSMQRGFLWKLAAADQNGPALPIAHSLPSIIDLMVRINLS